LGSEILNDRQNYMSNSKYDLRILFSLGIHGATILRLAGKSSKEEEKTTRQMVYVTISTAASSGHTWLRLSTVYPWPKVNLSSTFGSVVTSSHFKPYLIWDLKNEYGLLILIIVQDHAKPVFFLCSFAQCNGARLGKGFSHGVRM
jgi:hypothetical protein